MITKAELILLTNGELDKIMANKLNTYKDNPSTALYAEILIMGEEVIRRDPTMTLEVHLLEEWMDENLNFKGVTQ